MNNGCKLCSIGVQTEPGLSQNKIAKKYGVARSSVQRHLKHIEGKTLLGVVSPRSENEEDDGDGDDNFIGIPDEYAGMPLVRASIRRQDGSWHTYADDSASLDSVINSLSSEDIEEAIKNFEFTPAEATDSDETFTVVFSDLQTGKTDILGGTDELVTRVLTAALLIVEHLKEIKPLEIVFIDPGDIIENFYNTSSQRETNDLDLTNQIRAARRLVLQVIKLLVPLAPNFIYLSVPSNHATVRVGFKAPAGNSHNDWGLEIQEQIADVCAESPALSHVRFGSPRLHMESLTYETMTGTSIGVVHGHQVKSQDKIDDWWKGQAHGRMPVANADILVVGHWHNLRIQTTGNGRTIMVAPTLDNGSSWFSNLSGENSNPGVLTFTSKNGVWDKLKVF